MKKIISFVLVVIMLLGAVIAAIPAFAEEAEGTTFTIMGNNILGSFIYENGSKKDAECDILPVERYKKLYAAYKTYEPDIATFQECDPLWHDLMANLDDAATDNGVEGLSSLGYAYVETDNVPIREIRNAIYYKEDKFNLLEKGFGMYKGFESEMKGYGYPWCYSWGLLEAKEGGGKVIIVSTHQVWVDAYNWRQRNEFAIQLSEFLVELEAEYNAPIIAIGDFNAHPKEASYKTMTKILNSARDTAKETANLEYETYNTIGKSPAISEDGTGKIDHCFYSKVGITPLKYEILVTPQTYSYADHVPQRFEFKLYSPNHQHSFDGEWQNGNEAEHKKVCACGAESYEAHSFGNTVALKGSDYHKKVCSVCGYINYSLHTLKSAEKIDDNTHVGTCTECNLEVTVSHQYTWSNKDLQNCGGLCICGATAERAHKYIYTSISKGSTGAHKGECECGGSMKGRHVWAIEAEKAYGNKAMYCCKLCAEGRRDTLDMEMAADPSNYITDFSEIPTDTVESETPDFSQYTDIDTDTDTEITTSEQKTNGTDIKETDTEQISPKKGCGSSITAMSIVLMVNLGMCVTFASKKR